MLFWPCSIEVTLSFKLLWCSISTQDTTVASGLSEPRSTKSTFCGYGKELTSVCYPFHDVKCSCYLKNYCINVTRSYSSVFPPWVYWKSLQTIFFFFGDKNNFLFLSRENMIFPSAEDTNSTNLNFNFLSTFSGFPRYWERRMNHSSSYSMIKMLSKWFLWLHLCTWSVSKRDLKNRKFH